MAGQRPGVDPLADALGQEFKALIPIAEKPMLLHVVEALQTSNCIGEIRIMAQNINAIKAIGNFDVGVSADSIAATIAPLVAAMDEPMLITTADHALLTPEMIDSFVSSAAGHDLAVGLVERRTLIAAYPESKRTWLKFRGGQYSGANLFWIGSAKMLPILEIWRNVEQNRKKTRALLGAFGPFLLLGVALRLLSLEAALSRIGKRHGISIAPVILPQAEACIDVDNVADHRQVEEILRERV